MEPITQLLGSFFQLMCRDAAHIHSAASRDWAGAEVQIQHRGGLLGVFPIDFKEIPNLIQHNILRVGRADVVGINAKGEILGFHDAVVSLCLLHLNNSRQLPLDAFKLVRAQRD